MHSCTHTYIPTYINRCLRHSVHDQRLSIIWTYCQYLLIKCMHDQYLSMIQAHMINICQCKRKGSWLYRMHKHNYIINTFHHTYTSLIGSYTHTYHTTTKLIMVRLIIGDLVKFAVSVKYTSTDIDHTHIHWQILITYTYTLTGIDHIQL